jgi:hypothetical protein
MLQQRQLFLYFNSNKDVSFTSSAFKHFDETSQGIFPAQNYLENYIRQIAQEKVLTDANYGLPIDLYYGVINILSSTSYGFREWGIAVGQYGTSTIIHYQEFEN